MGDRQSFLTTTDRYKITKKHFTENHGTALLEQFDNLPVSRILPILYLSKFLLIGQSCNGNIQ